MHGENDNNKGQFELRGLFLRIEKKLPKNIMPSNRILNFHVETGIKRFVFEN